MSRLINSSKVTLTGPGLALLRGKATAKALERAMRKASTTSLRDMKSETSKRIRARKRLKVKAVNKALVRLPNRSKVLDRMEWGIALTGDPVRASAYPHRQMRAGVRVDINRGQKTLIRSAFVATVGGHRGVFLRRGAARLPIYEPIASRPVDAMLHPGEAEGVAARGRRSLIAGVDRLLPIELAKLRSKALKA